MAENEPVSPPALALARKMELIASSSLKASFQDFLNGSDPSKATQWSLWTITMALDKQASLKKDSVGRKQDTKVLGMLTMASQPSTGLCESTLEMLSAVDKTVIGVETWLCVESLVQEIEQRLCADVNWFFSLHWDDLLPDTAELVDVRGSAAAADVFRAFCCEMVGVRRTFLAEHYAAFTGGDVMKWFGTRTNSPSDGTREHVIAKWVSDGWIDGSGSRILPTFALWTVTEAGFKVWNSGISFYEHNRGTRWLETEADFMTRSEPQTIQALDNAVASLLASDVTMDQVSGSQLCSALMQQLVIPLDTAVRLGGQLFAAGYLMRVVNSDSESSSSESESDESGGEASASSFGASQVSAKHLFQPSVFRMYGLVELLKPDILNGRRLFFGPAPDEQRAVQLSQELCGYANKIWESVQHSGLQYSVIAAEPAWALFMDALYELRAVDLSLLRGDGAVAFWVNLHNTLFLHAYVCHREKFEPPESAKERACYCVGSQEFTLDTIFNGIVLGRATERWQCEATQKLTGLLMSTNYCVCVSAVSESKVEEAIATRAKEAFQAVELCEGNVLRVPRMVEAAVRDRVGDSTHFVESIIPFLSETWQGILGRILENKLTVTIDFNDEQEIYLWGGSVEDQFSVGAGKDLWALGVMKQSNEVRAKLAAVKGESQMLQMTFDQLSEEQVELKAAFEAQEEESKVLKHELQELKDKHQKLKLERDAQAAVVAAKKTKLTADVSQVKRAHESLTRFLQDECNGAQHASLTALFGRLLTLLPPDEPQGGGRASRRGRAKSATAMSLDFLLTRDPICVGALEDAPWKWVETEHLKWLKAKAKNLVPTLPGDDAFLTTIVRVHSEIAEDTTLLEQFFEKRLAECYARYFSTWRERTSLLLSEVLSAESETPAIVAANGWFQAENILVGVLRYRQYFPDAKELVDRLHQSIGTDPATLEMAAQHPDIIGLSKPGRFVLIKGRLRCKNSHKEDAEVAERDLVLFSDVLMVDGAFFYRLEQCVALENSHPLIVEVFNSGWGSRICLLFDDKETREAWFCMLSFSTSLTKLKFRHAAEHLKIRSQTLRNTKTVFDEEIEKEMKEKEKEQQRKKKNQTRAKSLVLDKGTVEKVFDTMK